MDDIQRCRVCHEQVTYDMPGPGDKSWYMACVHGIWAPAHHECLHISSGLPQSEIEAAEEDLRHAKATLTKST